MASKEQWAYMAGFAILYGAFQSSPTAAEAVGDMAAGLLVAYVAVALYNADPSAVFARATAWRN